MNHGIIDELVKRDYDSIQKKIGTFLKNEIKQRESNGVVFGLSGGIDSAVIAALCSKFVKENSLALIMPNSTITPESETNDAIALADSYSIDYRLINIGPVHNEYLKYLKPDPLAIANLGARIRANMLYYYANAQSSLVLGSSDKSEFLIGYFTKFGDGASDLLPISDIYKTQIREFAKSLKIPSNIISKPSGPHLWEGHIAETELGITYEEIDSILHCMIDKSLSMEETSEITEISISDIDRIYKMYKKSEHKRTMVTQCIL